MGDRACEPCSTDPAPFPEFIRRLPEPDTSLPGLRAWMLQTEDAMAMFYALPAGAELPEHVHGAQWGVVIAGRVDFTIAGKTATYKAGSTFTIPSGTPHSAVLHPGYVGIDVFADADRYRAKRRY